MCKSFLSISLTSLFLKLFIPVLLSASLFSLLLHIYRLGSEMVISLLLLCLLLRMKQTHRSPKSRHPKKKKLKIFQNRKDIKITIESNTCTEQNWTKKSFNNKTRDTLYLFYCCKNQFKIPFKPIRNPFQNTNHRVSYTKTTRD